MKENVIKFNNELTPPMSLENCEIVFVTPQMASDFLENMRPNRGVKRGKVFQYKHDLQNGRWKHNYVPLLFDKQGRLGDGQHRCVAIKESGIGEWFLIVRNLDDDVFNTVDIGSVRTPADIFRFAGYYSPNNAAAMVRSYLKLKEHTDNNSFGGGKSYSPQELIDVYNTDKQGFDNSLQMALSCNRKVGLLVVSYISSLIYYLIHDLGHQQEDVEDFFKQLFFRQDVSMKVINVLYDRLLKEYTNSRSGRRSITDVAKQLLVIKAWNAFVLKRDIGYLNVNFEKDKNLWFI